jgi:hypothetical protein
MDRKIVAIEPLEVVTIKHKHSFSIHIIDMRIFNSVTISVEFFDENGNYVERARLQLAGDDYSNWGADDNYLINYVAAKYGMQIKETVEPVTDPNAPTPYPVPPVPYPVPPVIE